MVQQLLFSQGFLHVKECSVLDFAEVLFTTRWICQIQMQTIQIQLSRNKGQTYLSWFQIQRVLLLHAERLALGLGKDLDVQFLWAPPAAAENIWKSFFFAVRVLKLPCSSEPAEVYIALTLLLFPLCAKVWWTSGRSWLRFVALTTTSLFLHTPHVPMGTWRLLGRVKAGF